MEILKFKDKGRIYIPVPATAHDSCGGCQVGSEACKTISSIGACEGQVFVMLTKHKASTRNAKVKTIPVRFNKEELRRIQKRFENTLGKFFHEGETPSRLNVGGKLYELVDLVNKKTNCINER